MMNLILLVIAILLLYLLFKDIMKSTEIKKYITGGDAISYHNAIKKIRKSPNHLQPIYESFMNSWESIKELSETEDITSQSITIRMLFVDVISANLFKKDKDITFELQAFEVEDTGLGLTEESYKRLQKLYDESKSFNNRGSGRIQYLHFFTNTYITSNYKEEDKYHLREVVLSKKGLFPKKNALIGVINEKVITTENYSRKTQVKLDVPIYQKDLNFYSKLTADSLKENLLKQFMGLLCLSEKLPNIIIENYKGHKLVEKATITKSDFPEIDKKLEFSVFYSKSSETKSGLESSERKELFTLNTFKIPSKQLDKNIIEVTSKGQILSFDKNPFEFPILNAEEVINNNRYLFLLSSPYIDNVEGDERGKINLISKKEFLSGDLFIPDEVVLIDSIQENIDETTIDAYPDIKEKKEKKLADIEELKKTFLLDKDIIDSIKVSINDTAETILKKVYKKQADDVAKSDALIQKELNNIKMLNPTADTYYEDLEKSANTITTEIPLQNRTALTQYVARRGIVLNLFEKALNRELNTQTTARNNDEQILHNILFKQKSNNVESSDLWMLNEDFMLYTGCSEFKLKNLEYNGKNILKTDDQLTQEQIEWRDSLGKKRYDYRIDTILFPSEGKCVILEYKSPNVMLTDRITQVHNYASLIRNFAKDEFDITLFYGYLIGDRINANELKFHGTGFKPSHDQEYYYCPNKPVEGVWDRENKDAAMYMEILTYKSLLTRAFRRNKILFDKINVDFDLNKVEDKSSKEECK
ncbi:hypothetical protein [Bacteroides propionicifaciens]|uniref:hypothetical protein n=1 Tax=Bacteroides propionicifaciens TaxID=392838 RepID=UPI0003A3CED7|nr:hypothetical protein [Bacteroides propionicifaciens]